MQKRCIFILAWLFLTLATLAQNSTINRIKSLISQANTEALRTDDREKRLVTAMADLDQAISLAEKNRLPSMFYEASVAKTELLFRRGKLQEMELMLRSSRDSLKAEIARHISRYHNDGSFVRRNEEQAIRYAKLSLEMSRDSRDVLRQINASNQLGYVYMTSENIDEAEPYFLEVTKLGQNLKSENVAFAYSYLIVIYERQGYPNRAVDFGLNGIRYVEFAGYTEYLHSIYLAIARIYSGLDQQDKSFEFYSLLQQEAIKRNNISGFWYASRGLSDIFIKKSRFDEAQRLLDEASKKFPLRTTSDTLSIYLAYARLHLVRGNYTATESYLRECARVNKDPNNNMAINKLFAEMYFVLGQFGSAKEAVARVLEKPGRWTASQIAATHQLAYRIDSARNELAPALYHLRTSQRIIDSVHTVSRLRQVEELTMEYETETIRKDVQLKEQAIQLLEKQQVLQSVAFNESRLQFALDSTEKENRILSMSATSARQGQDLAEKQRDIQSLQNESAAKNSSLIRARSTRDITLIIIAFLILTLVLIARQYMARQAANKLISEKNTALEKVIDQKESLLKEKDWLLKEVHHRVKNNLQTVVSLLESQAMFLNSDALSANQDSRNRVYAMSLVHQKLYQSKDVASIQMDVYIRELIQHLRDSLELRKVNFQTELASVQLDVSQAISLGLILNEAITNSLKHAFPETVLSPSIIITLSQLETGQLQLLIADNGIGVPENTPSRPESLGLRLMRGLTGDMQGDYSIIKEHGTKIMIRFVPEVALSGRAGG